MLFPPCPPTFQIFIKRIYGWQRINTLLIDSHLSLSNNKAMNDHCRWTPKIMKIGWLQTHKNDMIQSTTFIRYLLDVIYIVPFIFITIHPSDWPTMVGITFCSFLWYWFGWFWWLNWYWIFLGWVCCVFVDACMSYSWVHACILHAWKIWLDSSFCKFISLYSLFIFTFIKLILFQK